MDALMDILHKQLNLVVMDALNKLVEMDALNKLVESLDFIKVDVKDVDAPLLNLNQNQNQVVKVKNQQEKEEKADSMVELIAAVHTLNQDPELEQDKDLVVEEGQEVEVEVEQEKEDNLKDITLLN